jgi:hypothetical protein
MVGVVWKPAFLAIVAGEGDFRQQELMCYAHSKCFSIEGMYGLRAPLPETKHLGLSGTFQDSNCEISSSLFTPAFQLIPLAPPLLPPLTKVPSRSLNISACFGLRITFVKANP